MTARTLVSYEPNPLLAWLYHRFFEHIEVDDAWAAAVREADARGTVVYALRNLSFIDFFALDYLTKRFVLPQVRFANDLGLWVLEPMGRGWLRALQKHDEASDADDLRRAVLEGSSAALFLKRPAGLGSAARRGTIEGDPYLRALFDAQRATERPILIVPQVFVWSKHADSAKHTVIDSILGPREWPGKVRTVAQFLANYRSVALRAGEPVDLKQFLAQNASNGASSDDVLVRRLTYTLLRRLERERRSVIGPTMKPADRLRNEVIRSPKLQKIIADMAGEGSAERQVITARALSMLREMEAAPDMGAVTAIKPAFQGAMSRMYSAIELDEPGLARVRTAMKDGSIVLLPSHKSHLDYMVLTHVFLTHHLQLPLIAAGDNLNFFPLGAVFRRAGAFFIRRSFGSDRLYGAVVDAYVRRLIKDGWTLEFFLEGGRSRTGKLLAPKVGLLSLVVDAALGVERPVYFVPISIGYERVVEEKAFVNELSGGEKKPEDVRGLLAGANAIAQRYGRLNVQFGEVLTLDNVLREIDPQAKLGGDTKLTPAKRRAIVTRLAYRVMNEINRVTAVTPGALVATALLTHGKRGLPHADLERACVRIASILRRFGARFAPSLAHPENPEGLRIDALREACDLFLRAGNIEVRTPGEGARARAGGERRGGAPGATRSTSCPIARACRSISRRTSSSTSSSRARWSRRRSWPRPGPPPRSSRSASASAPSRASSSTSSSSAPTPRSSRSSTRRSPRWSPTASSPAWATRSTSRPAATSGPTSSSTRRSSATSSRGTASPRAGSGRSSRGRSRRRISRSGPSRWAIGCSSPARSSDARR